MCCGLCCKEFKGWCRSFTRTERILTVIEAALLVVLVVFLVFLILHLLACTSSEYKPDKEKLDYEEVDEPTKLHELTTIPHNTTEGSTPTETTSLTETIKTTSKHKTIDPNVECSWTPSAKTTSLTHYFEQTATQAAKIEPYDGVLVIKQTKTASTTTKRQTYTKPAYAADFIEEDQSDGEDADPVQNEYILSLVKLKPQGAVFGCILTTINKFFMLTSASCIEAIEEVDALDSFVIMEQYGTSSNGKSRAILDLQIHPFYQGVNRSYDLALVRSPSPLPGRTVTLPSPLDAALITIGERLHILGFGPYRSSDSRSGRRLRQAAVFLLPAQQCAGPVLRHLEAPRAVGGGEGPGGGGALCAGVLFARGLPCQYCGGAPLLSAPAPAPARLLGLMSDNPQCGVACEPQLYVNIAACRDWIDSIVNG